MIKSYIWTFVNRFLHVLLIISFSLAYLFADFHELFYYHALLGVIFFVVIFFRFIWGFVGTKYSLFKDFNFKGVFEYLFSIIKEKKKFIGHNPASSIAIVLMIILGFLTFISGIIALGAEERAGYFSNLYFSYSIFKDFKDLHEFFVNALLGVVIIHICGALIDKFFNKNDGIDSMISGYKMTKNDESVKLNIFQKIFFGIYLIFLISLFIYLLYPKNIIIGTNQDNIKTEFTYNVNSNLKVYKKECGSCHIAYPAYLLPKKAWVNIMDNLENHFGDDASLDEEDKNKVLAFLEQNSMEEFDTKFKTFMYKENTNEIAITKYEFFKRAHKNIPEKVFTSQKIKSKANCQNCHQNAEQGIFSKSQVKF